MQIDTVAIGQRLKEFRKKYDIPQKSLALKADINRSFITNVETGKQNPSFDFISKLLINYNISSDWLITGRGQMFLINEIDVLNRINDDHIEILNALDSLPKEKSEEMIKTILVLLSLCK